MFNVLKQCRHGLMLLNLNDQLIGRSLDRYGEFSQGEVAFFERLLRPGDVVIEVGAHIGAHTVRMAQLVGAGGQMHAFEPQRLLAQALNANLAINSIASAYVYPWAVGARDGDVRVPLIDYDAPGNFGALELGEDAAWKRHAPIAHCEIVPVVTLDSVFSGLPRLRLLKIAVEGMELDVLKGARQLIARTSPFLYVENNRPAKSDALIAEMRRPGHTLHWHRPPLFDPSNFLKNTENVFSSLHSAYLLGIPPGEKSQLDGLELKDASRVESRESD